MQNEKQTSLTRSEMIRLKAKAIRKGVWFRALTALERACIDLTVRVVERVRSRLLQRTLASVLKKLEEAMQSKVCLLMRKVGGNLAKELSEIAQTWGHKSAASWAEDCGFIRYLTITRMNAPP